MSLPLLKELEVWLVVGSQHLYGPETLQTVESHAREVARGLDQAETIPTRVVFKAVATTPSEVTAILTEANCDDNCVGVVVWMHTFSPAKMWISGLKKLDKPLLHLHTQFNREIPWSTIDMDFMNLNQSAHGGREFGFICTRLRIPRKVVVGHWSCPTTQESIGVWSRAACARHDLQSSRFVRIGDNMREVAVTEGDKVAAEEAFGFSVNGYGVGTLVECVQDVSDSAIDDLCSEYVDEYKCDQELRPGNSRHQSLRDAAAIELGLHEFLNSTNAVGFTDTFEDLVGLKQLPGIGAQRLMASGYGFGAEGDWKAAAMVRASKVMAQGLPGGTSFMEDYTYHMPGGSDSLVLGAHMLEICPTIAADRPSCEIHPLSIGGKEDPVRLVFDTAPGPAVNATLIDLGDRFRLLVNEVETVASPESLPNLPVARAVWRPAPDFATAAAAWIYAGGSHHPVFSQALTIEHYEDLAEMLNLEIAVIDSNTRLREFKRNLSFDP